MQGPRFRYFVIYKPYGMISQFTPENPGDITLKTLDVLPNDVYPVGRLDKDSEGLLLLTNDPSINMKLLHPRNGHTREYYVQVEGVPTQEALEKLRNGVDLKTDTTAPAEAALLKDEPKLPPRNPPVRFRAAIPTSWISLTLTEGKNRQLRKMTAAVGFPTLRLVRWRIENLTLHDMKPGEVRELEYKLVHKKLGLE